MHKHSFIAGDWGTSNLRLYLCQYNKANSLELLDTRFGPGVSAAQGDFEDLLFNQVQEWLDQFGAMPVILSGMIGSNLGWKEAPYLHCPVDVAQIAKGRISFSARGTEISILAGLRTINPLRSSDIMRGEELQVLGWMRAKPEIGPPERLFALPGTHNKWAWVENSQIKTFLTAYTGELFALLRKHSILISDDGAISFNQDVFMQGVEAVENLHGAHLVHALFATRSRQVLGEMPSADSLSYLSGLLTGADVLGAANLFSKMTTDPLHVTVIGEPILSRHYLLALEHFGIQSECCDPAAIAIAGFETVYKALYLNAN